MEGDPNKNYMFFHHPDHPVPIPIYVRLSCDATAGSSAVATGDASTSSSTGGAVGRVDLKDQPDEFLMYIYKVKRCSKTKSTPSGERRRGATTPPSIDTAASPASSSGRGGNAPGARAASTPTASSSSGSTPPATAPVCARTATPAPAASASLLTPLSSCARRSSALLPLRHRPLRGKAHEDRDAGFACSESAFSGCASSGFACS